MPHRLPTAIAAMFALAALTVVGTPCAADIQATDRSSPRLGIDAAHSSDAVADVPGSSGYRTPAVGRVLRLFDPPAQRWAAGHRGVDLASDDGIVSAPGAGVVTFSGTVVDRGVVTITHADGLRSSLEPVGDAPAAGTTVRAGDPVGTVESVGHCSRACVHWGVRRGETYLDPLSLLGREPVVLLPVP
jgi:murein DD-endopeptidase MepM/ murein hydrolase activator NlpD